MGAQDEAQRESRRPPCRFTVARLEVEDQEVQALPSVHGSKSFLLDTNVVSEWTKPRPNGGVMAWLAEVDEDGVYLSVVTIAELRHGIERLAAGNRREQLDGWLRQDLPLRFEGRVLAIDFKVADECGRLLARREAKGQPIHAMDALIAATAQVHGLTVVSRNVDDLRASVKSILNPWT